MKEIRQMNAIAVTGALFDGVPPSDYLQQARDAGAMTIHLRYGECTAPRMREIHSAGFQSLAWMRGPAGMAQTAWGETKDVYRALLDTGVQQRCVIQPHLLMQVLEEDDKE